MSIRVLSAYLALVAAALLVWALAGAPWWAMLIIVVVATVLFGLAAWFGFTRRDEGRHLADDGREHRSREFTVPGWMQRVVWSRDDEATEEIGPALPDAIAKSRGQQ